MTRLLLIEGICGAGKTTLGGQVAKVLAARGESVSFYDEGAPEHPVSLNGYAFLWQRNFAALCARFPNAAWAMRQYALHGNDYVLVPYRDVVEIAHHAELAACLRAKELCWTDMPSAPFALHCDARVGRWEWFVRSALSQDRVFVMESVFLQHPIHDLRRLYRASDAEIGAFVRRVADAIMPLHPLLLYLSPDNVEAHQRRIAAVREKPHYLLAESIQRVQERQQLEKALIRALPFPAEMLAYDEPDFVNINRCALEGIAAHGVGRAG